MSDQAESVIGVYSSMSGAEEAVRKLDEGGFPITQVSIVTQDLESEKEIHGYVTVGDVATSGAGTGAWFGGIVGLLVGAAFLWVPGVGPLIVAGPLSVALLGGLEGAAVGAGAGGLLGALMGWGVSKRHVLKYEDRVKAGNYLVIAHGSAAEVARAHGIFKESGADEVDAHAHASV